MMSEWKKIAINKQNIKHQTGKATLIAMPHKSDYDGYEFWIPSKLLRRGSHSYELYLSFTDDFNFTIKKMGKGQYNRFKAVDEKTLSAEAMREAFGGVVEPEAEPDNGYVQVDEPEYRKPTENKVDGQLAL